jgi:hypothetical protein
MNIVGSTTDTAPQSTLSSASTETTKAQAYSPEGTMPTRMEASLRLAANDRFRKKRCLKKPFVVGVLVGAED